MKKEKAKEMVSACIRNGLYANGILDEKPPKINCVSLQHLLNANKVVEKLNKETKNVEGTRTVHMTIADRGIAAMYTALNFEGGSPNEPNVVGYANGNYVIVIHEKYLKFSDSEE